jgi:molybdopterin/thiamine biosynthesis adenylyltransferase
LTLEVSAGQVAAAIAATDGAEIAVPFVRRVGPGLSFVALTEGETETARFDRQERVFGRAGQLVLSALHIGVVGAGGTGSAVIEQLVRLGVGRITVVDDDHVSETNLTRIHQSTSADVGMSKCELAGRLARGLGVYYKPVSGRVTQPSVAKELTSCDIVFGCTDDHAGRIVLARMAPRYLQLLIDVGVTVDVVDGEVVGAPCRISIQEPGEACLVCRGSPFGARSELVLVHRGGSGRDRP